MEIAALLNNKTLKAKAKTATLANWLLDRTITADELTAIAATAKDPAKATCIEALEFASKQEPGIVNANTFMFVMECLRSTAPRVKWESAKVIGNTALLFADKSGDAIKNLLENSEYKGTVVRWSAAFALGEILKLNTKYNTALLPAIEAICQREEKNSIKKIYLAAIKKTK